VILAATPALAMPQAVPDFVPAVTFVAGSCYAIGQQVAADNGGTLAKASEDVQGGQPVCRIVVLVKGKDGERPRRTEIVVPQG
jgi:hypothetical protein